ncbi:Protein of unknown function [Bacillus mycoides]|nr:Protein of unknown function [Bacillus mycoides]
MSKYEIALMLVK